MSTQPQELSSEETLPSFHFVYCRHTVDTIPRIAQALSHCDLFLLETVGAHIEDIHDTYETLNDITYAEKPYAEVADFVASHTDRAEDLNEYFDLLLAFQLYGSGRSILPIDVSAEHPSYALQQQADWAQQSFWEQVRYGNIPLRSVEQSLRETLAIQAEAYRAREQVVAAQLIEYALQNSEDPDKKVRTIGVVQGATHTSTSHQLRREGLRVTTQFVDQPDMPKDGVHIVFPALETASRFRRFKTAPIPNDLLEQILLEGIIAPRIALPPADGRHEEEWLDTLNTLRSQIIGHMSPPVRRNFLENWERIQNSSAKGRKQRLRDLVGDIVTTYDVED